MSCLADDLHISSPRSSHRHCSFDQFNFSANDKIAQLNSTYPFVRRSVERPMSLVIASANLARNSTDAKGKTND